MISHSSAAQPLLSQLCDCPGKRALKNSFREQALALGLLNVMENRIMKAPTLGFWLNCRENSTVCGSELEVDLEKVIKVG